MSCKMLSNFLKVTSIALVTATAFFCLSDQEAAYSQRSASLFSMCVTSGVAGTRTRDVVIGRELFTSFFNMSAHGGTTSTCRIRPSNSQYKFKTLRLAFGIEDENVRYYGCKSPIVVNVYLDGNLEESRSLLPSEKSLLLLNVSRISSVTVEVPKMRCEGTVQFTQAILEPISTAPGRR